MIRNIFNKRQVLYSMIRWVGVLVKNNNFSNVIVSLTTYKCELVIKRKIYHMYEKEKHSTCVIT